MQAAPSGCTCRPGPTRPRRRSHIVPYAFLAFIAFFMAFFIAGAASACAAAFFIAFFIAFIALAMAAREEWCCEDGKV